MGAVIRFEIHADDPARAAAFYTALLGWEATEVEGLGIAYWSVRTRAGATSPGIDGAILQRPGARPEIGADVVGAVITAEVADIDVALAKAAELGAVLAMEKMAVAGIGTVAYVIDTENNVVGLLQPE